MAHYNIFRDELAIRYPAFGYALWEPGPSSGRLYSPVEVGDVGYVREGKFHRLFNALLPAYDQSHVFGVPEHYEPLIPKCPDIDRGKLSRGHFCSTGVNITAEENYKAERPDDDGFSQVSFLCTRQQGGAVLSLPVQAQRQDALARRDFGRHLLKHIKCWFTFARDRVGLEQMEEIVLVTGCHRTKSSANVAFLELQGDAEASFGAEGLEARIEWRFSPKRIRGAVINPGPDGNLTDLPEDQCIFFRGFRVARVFGTPLKQLRAAAGPNPDLDGYDSEPDMELISIPAATKYRDPLHLLLEYVAKRAPDCDMVLVHDDDLARIDGLCDIDETLQPDAVMSHLQRSKPEVQRVQCDSLFVNENSSRTSTEAVRVAMFSKEFQEWNLPPTFTASQSNMPHYTSESSVVALRTLPDRLPTEGTMSIPQDRLSHAFSCTPSSHINSPPPVLAMEEQPQDWRFLSDLDGSADLSPSSPTPDKYNIPPHHSAFRSPDLRLSSPHLPATPSHSGSPYSVASKVVFHSDKDEVLGNLNSDSLIIPPREYRDPSERDAPSSTGLSVSDVGLSGVNDSDRMSVSVSPAGDPHPSGYHDWGFPSSSTGGAESRAEDDRRSPASSESPHLGINPSRHLDQFRIESPSHQAVPTSGRLPCPWPGCSCSFPPGRRQDLERHIVSHHLPYSLFCPVPCCLWRGVRKDQFWQHSRNCHPDHGLEPGLIYDTKPIIYHVNHGVTTGRAEKYALDLVAERALELGRTKEWEDLWGDRLSRLRKTA